MPASVTNVQIRGSIMFTGHWVEMGFQITPADFDSLLRSGGFSPADLGSVPSNWFKAELSQFPVAEFYRKRGGEFDDLRPVFIMATTNHQQVFVRYFRG
jgi:hypothetical protein